MIDTQNRLAQLFSIVHMFDSFEELFGVIKRLQAMGLDFGLPKEGGRVYLQVALAVLLEEGVVRDYYPVNNAPCYFVCWKPCELDSVFRGRRNMIEVAVATMRRESVTSKRRVLDSRTLVTIINLLGRTKSVGQLHAILYLLGYDCDFVTHANGHRWSADVRDMLRKLVDTEMLDMAVRDTLVTHALTAACHKAMETFGWADVDTERICLLRDAPVDVVIRAAGIQNDPAIELLERLR